MANYFIGVAFLILIAYCILMSYFVLGLRKLMCNNSVKPKINQPEENTRAKLVSIVVCFRNEEQHILTLLHAFKNQLFSSKNYEVLLYNDASDDGSLRIVNQFINENPMLDVYCYPLNKESGLSAKKSAINQAAQHHSKAPIIVTTDADCTMGEYWLRGILESFTNNKYKLLIGAVGIYPSNLWFNLLQQTEIAALSASAAGSLAQQKPLMCSGANMAFLKDTFLTLNAYKNNQQISSGDDMFLLDAFSQKYPGSIGYNISSQALVNTHPQNSIRNYFNQKIRWVSKVKYIENRYLLYVGIIVSLSNAALLFLSLCAIIYPKVLVSLSIYLVIKNFFDFILLKRAKGIVLQQFSFIKLLLLQFPESLFSVLVLMMSFKGNYLWKERRFINSKEFKN